ENAASGPLTSGVQSPPLSSIHLPAASCLTISDTRGGVGRSGAIGGAKAAPAFGGAFVPAYGPAGSVTTLGGKPMFMTAPPPRTVLFLPESWMATSTRPP